MKTILFASFVLLVAVFTAQNSAQEKKKTTSNAATQIYNGGYRDTCLNKKFSVVFYGFNDSLLTRTAQTFSLATSAIITLWNQTFSRICVSFENCSTVVLPDYTFNIWEYLKSDNPIIKSRYTENTINIYLPDKFESAKQYETGAYAYAPAINLTPPFNPAPQGAHQSSLSVLVVERGGIQLPPTFKKDLLHATGHFFGLPDTFAECGIPASPTSTNGAVISTEFSDGSNANVNGDRFTDTEADCYPAGLSNLAPRCEFENNVTDGKGQYYVPPVDNYMSKWPCACRFTQQQYNFMAWFIMNYRLNLH